MLKAYYMLTKPGIIMGNAITTAAGFALASQGNMDYILFIATLLGLACIIASAGVFNNYIDRAADAKMLRTQQRALATGVIAVKNALIYAALLLCIGVAILTTYTNPLTVCIALTGFFVYLFLYAYWKYRSFHGTLIGSVAGAVPPVVGYCAVSNQFDLGASLLFMILVFWQMPHFFAIAIYRLEDYAAASIPVLPLKKGMHTTKVQMIAYIIIFMIATTMLTILGYTGKAYLIIALLLGILWLGLGLTGFRLKIDQTQWARQMFIASLVVITGLCTTLVFS